MPDQDWDDRMQTALRFRDSTHEESFYAEKCVQRAEQDEETRDMILEQLGLRDYERRPMRW